MSSIRESSRLVTVIAEIKASLNYRIRNIVMKDVKAHSRYEDIATSREACIAIVECNPHHIKHLQLGFIDNGLMVLALRLGANLEEIPA
jgi:hypothetical protein